MSDTRRGLKPGWVVLLATLAYAALVTTLLVAAREEVAALNLRLVDAASSPTDPTPAATVADARLTDDVAWMPIPGARLPSDDAYYPGAPRAYRSGVSQGITFYGDDVGVPIVAGTPVIAVVDGTLERLDLAYREPSEEEWQALLEAVADGADDPQMDRLRGRQVWLTGDDGRTYRYAHLSSIEAGLVQGQRVVRGSVLGRVGNSGTDDGVRGTGRGVRLHFEVWEGASFLGEGREPAAVRADVAALLRKP